MDSVIMSQLLISHLVFFSLFYLWGLKKNDFSVADIAWGLSFLLIFSVGCFLNFEPLSLRVKLVGICVILWSFRLSGYIFMRSLKAKKEDARYTEMRNNWGEKANVTAYFRVFLLQGLLSLLIGYPLFLVHGDYTTGFGKSTDFLGLTFFVIGFFWESVADYQKNAFKQKEENKDKLCTVGLWQYSRYPNYFGEILLWWGLTFVISSQVPFYIVLWGPLLLSLLIIKVSGIALLEKKYETRSGFTEYKRKTNLLIPWFPKGE